MYSILMILFHLPQSGTFWRGYHFAKNLLTRGHSVTMLITSPKNKWNRISYTHDGITFIESPDLFSGMLRSGWDPLNTLSRISWINDNKFDIIHAFESRPAVIYPSLFGKSKGSTLIMDWCDFFGKEGSVEERKNPLIKTVLRPIESYFENHFRTRAAGTIVISTLLEQKAINLGVSSKTILRLNNGCDTSLKPIDRDQARRIVNLPVNIPIIGYLGNIYPTDLQFMIESINKILDINPKVKFLILGKSNWKTNSPLVNPSSIIRIGEKNIGELHTYLSACDICWIPLVDNLTNQGRFPMKINNYMSAGRPTVATNVGDLGKYIIENNAGIVTDASIDSFANQSIQLIDDGPKQILIGDSARYAAENQCNWSTVTDQLENFYTKIHKV